jgi:HAD superfamily hydrolase (TIGR01490 family)
MTDAPNQKMRQGEGRGLRISIFDLDRTLTLRPTYLEFLLFAASEAAPWRKLFIPLILVGMISYKLKLMSRKRLKEIMHALMLGRSVDQAKLQGVVALYVDRLFDTGLLPKAVAALKKAQAEGERIIIATAANDYYAPQIAARLGVSEVVCTCFEVRDGKVIARIVGQNCHGAAKREMVLAYLADQGLSLSDCSISFYSDDESDAPLFEVVGRPVAVNATAGLRRLAEAKGWPLLDWR